jgi:hypothetical protein
MKSARYSCEILINFNYLDRFSKNPQIPNFIKIRPVGAELLHTDGRGTDGQQT